MKVLPRRLRTHYYRDRAEGVQRRRDIAALYEKYAADARTIWSPDFDRAAQRDAG